MEINVFPAGSMNLDDSSYFTWNHGDLEILNESENHQLWILDLEEAYFKL